MKIVTIQNKAVLNIINTEGIYKASYSRVSENLLAPYKALAKEYNYTSCPIFAGVVGKYCEFYGAKTEHSVALELDIPDEEVSFQDYYNWVDVIYYMEASKEEFEETFNTALVPNIETYTKMVLNDKVEPNRAVQATIPYIKKEWIINTLSDLTKFEETHVGSGGRDILNELNYY